MSKLYDSKGGYAGYNKNNKEREALDYYCTPTKEVINILNIIDFPIDNHITILEPCAGGGHMLLGIYDYLTNNGKREINNIPYIIATDIKARVENNVCQGIQTGEKFDFLSKEYPYTTNIDFIIMNPPYTTIEPFVMRALEIANKGVLVLARLQFLEGESRFNKIFSVAPPSDVYIYVDRICCYKNGDTTTKPASIQAYAWFYFDTSINNKVETKVHWIRRVDKINNDH